MMVQLPEIDASAVVAAVATLAAATPAEIDTALYPIEFRLARAEQRLESAMNWIEKINKGERGYSAHDLPRAQESADRAYELIDEINREAAPLRAVYSARGGWTRAFKVTNGNGHIHSTMTCHSCYATTKFALLPQVSGMDEKDIVELAGDMACRFCYPNGRTPHPCQLFTPEEIEDRAFAKAERERKAAERAAKGIVDAETGGELTTKSYGVIKAERTAQIEYVREACEARMWEGKLRYAQSDRTWDAEVQEWVLPESKWLTTCTLNAQAHRADALKILAALAAKRGTTMEEQAEALAAKVEAKYRKEYRSR